MTDFFDDIDLGGSVVGVIHVPPERILGDTPDAPVLKVEPRHTSRSPVTVFKWQSEPDFILTLTVGVKVTRKDLSEAIQEWRTAHPRIDKIKCYVDTRHPLANLAIFTLQKCGFNRIGVELVWERDLTQRAEPKPVAPVPPKPERESWDASKDSLKSLRERQDFCAKSRIVFMQSELDHIAWLEEHIAAQKAFQSSPEAQQLDADILAAKEAADAHLAKLKSKS